MINMPPKTREQRKIIAEINRMLKINTKLSQVSLTPKQFAEIQKLDKTFEGKNEFLCCDVLIIKRRG